jgi:hypothetical protein
MVGAPLPAEAQERDTVTPNLPVLTEVVVEEIRGATLDDQRLLGVDILRVERIDDLIAGKNYSRFSDDIPQGGVYAVHAVARLNWWKWSRDYLFILREEVETCKKLLVYKGGGNGNGISYRIIDLGDAVPDPIREGTWLRQRSILIDDRESGNSSSKNRALIFRHNQQDDAFEKIFDDVITFTASPPLSGVLGYESTLDFERSRRNEKYRVLHDLVLVTQIVTSYDDDTSKPPQFEPVKNIFTWDGHKYVGSLELPAAARRHHDLAIGNVKRLHGNH